MPEPTRIFNGRFVSGSDNWTLAATAAHIFTDGAAGFGCISLPANADYIEQDFTAPGERIFTLNLAVKGVGAAVAAGELTVAILEDGGSTLISESPATSEADLWEPLRYRVGLGQGNTYTLRITRASGSTEIRLDDIWLWFVPVSRAELAAQIHDKLGALATSASLSTSPSGEKLEGSYSFAIDNGLRSVGAINSFTGEPDIRYLTAESLQTALDHIERSMLEQLRNYFANQVDVKAGPISESLSQRAGAIGEMLSSSGGAGGGGPVVMRKLSRPGK